jgi:phosphonate transport system ATP-binding protein
MSNATVPAPATPILQLQTVSHQFDRAPVLIDINLTIVPGERVALVGASGAGKSTLLKLLNATIQPTAGTVIALDRPIKRLNAKKLRQVQQQIGLIDQRFNLIDQLRVIHNVNAGHLGRWPVWKALISLLIIPLDRATALAALTQVGIPEKIDDRTDRLSGGQQQRVAIARVLVQDPLVILADEPTASLDPELSRDIMQLLCDLCQAQGRTLVISLHDVELAQQYCDRMIGLRAGQIMFDLPTPQVTAEQLHQLYQRI